MDENVVEGWRNRATTSTVNEVFLYQVYVEHILTPLTCCGLIIAEDLHYFVVGDKAFCDVITRDEREDSRHAVDVSLETIRFHTS